MISCPELKNCLKKEMTSGYIGFDPTADSLHIGHMVQVMLLVHFQRPDIFLLPLLEEQQE